MSVRAYTYMCVCAPVVADTYRVTYYTDVQQLREQRAGKGLCYSLTAGYVIFWPRADITERRFRLLRNVPGRAPPPPTPTKRNYTRIVYTHDFHGADRVMICDGENYNTYNMI